MKKAIAILAAGLMSFGIANTASAKKTYHLIPESSSFTGSGTTSATKNGITLKCKAKFQGSVNAQGVGSITGGSFSGALGCSAVSLSGLPWAATAVNATKVVISGATFTSLIGNCGPRRRDGQADRRRHQVHQCGASRQLHHHRQDHDQPGSLRSCRKHNSRMAAATRAAAFASGLDALLLLRLGFARHGPGAERHVRDVEKLVGRRAAAACTLMPFATAAR